MCIRDRAEIAPALGGATDISKAVRSDLELLPEEFRLQRISFKAAAKAFAALEGRFTGKREYLVFQLIRLVDAFLASNKIDIPSLFHQEPLRRRILFALNMDLIVQHLLRHIAEQNVERLEPVFDEEFPIGSTRGMRTWYTTKPCQPTRKSQISHMLADSAWEQHAANVLEMSERVATYAKNDHLGFQLHYLWNGVRRRYLPDFIVLVDDGHGDDDPLHLIVEIKGYRGEDAKDKKATMDTYWVPGVNHLETHGRWAFAEFTDVFQMQEDFGKRVAEEFERMLAAAVS